MEQKRLRTTVIDGELQLGCDLNEREALVKIKKSCVFNPFI